MDDFGGRAGAFDHADLDAATPYVLTECRPGAFLHNAFAAVVPHDGGGEASCEAGESITKACQIQMHQNHGPAYVRQGLDRGRGREAESWPCNATPCQQTDLGMPQPCVARPGLYGAQARVRRQGL